MNNNMDNDNNNTSDNIDDIVDDNVKMDTNIDIKNVKLDPHDLYKYLTIDRRSLPTFISNNLHKLEYQHIVDALREICEKESITIRSLFEGNIGYQCNSRMAFTVFPTINLYRVINKIMNKLMINRLEEFGSGIGLMTYCLKMFNARLYDQNDYDYNCNQLHPYYSHCPLESVKGSDPLYELEYSANLDGVNLQNKDITDYATNDMFDEKIGILIVSPSSSPYNDMLYTIKCFMTLRKPKLVMIIGNLKNEDYQINEYNMNIIKPKIVCMYDTLGYNMNMNMNYSTNYNMYVYTRNDININFNIILNDIKMDTLDDIKSPVLNFFHKLNELCMIPKNLLNLDEKNLYELMEFMYTYKVKKIPDYLTIETIDKYVTMYRIAVEKHNDIPDLLSSEENLNNVIKLTEMVYDNADVLKKKGIIPRRLNNLEEIYDYIILDNCFSDKITTRIYGYHTN